LDGCEGEAAATERVEGIQVEITATQTRSYDDRFNIFFFTTPLPVLASEISGLKSRVGRAM